jgi:hypothetical protein
MHRMTIAGIPVVPLAESPPLGSIGDLVLVDWGQYLISYLPLNSLGSSLAIDFAVPNDRYNQGTIGLPADASEVRMSDHAFFDTDRIIVLAKLRADGNLLWPGTTTNGSNTVGPCAVLC